MNGMYYLEQKKNTHLYFKVGQNTYAVNTGNVLEIMKLPALDYPQKLPNNIVGLLKYNNFVINVIDIRFYLNIDVSNYTANNDLIIVKTDETIFGIITDRIFGIIPFESSQIDTIPFIDNKTIIDSIYKYNDDTIFIINIYSIENLLKEDLKLEKKDILSLFPSDEHSLSVMRNRTRSISEKSNLSFVSGELYTKKKFISFNIENDLYCIPLEYVKEVLNDAVITNVPGTPEFIEGIMNLRGDYITALNIKKFLNIKTHQEQKRSNELKTPVIIIDSNDMELAFLIDKINGLFDVPEDVIVESSEGYFSAEFILDDIPYTILNVEKIFTDKRIIVTDM